MSEDAFVHWQKVTRGHFTATCNLVLGLATGLLAFFSERFFAGPRPTGWPLFLGAISMVALTVSVALALWCNVNRLRDFRATAQIARRRLKNEPISPEARSETEALGRLSWILFWWQLLLFGIGAVASACAFVANAW